MLTVYIFVFSPDRIVQKEQSRKKCTRHCRIAQNYQSIIDNCVPLFKALDGGPKDEQTLQELLKKKDEIIATYCTQCYTHHRSRNKCWKMLKNCFCCGQCPRAGACACVTVKKTPCRPEIIVLFQTVSACKPRPKKKTKKSNDIRN